MNRSIKWIGISLLTFASLTLSSSTSSHIACEGGQGALGSSPAALKIDAQKSTMTVHVGKTGALSAFGHDHDISAPLLDGTVKTGKSPSVQIRVNAKNMKVADAGDSAKDYAEIQSTMVGPQVLNVAKYPVITFKSTSAKADGPDKWMVRGNLTLHGQTHPVDVAVTHTKGHYTGTATFLQTAFGITPVKAGGGAVRVKDELQIKFDIVVPGT